MSTADLIAQARQAIAGESHCSKAVRVMLRDLADALERAERDAMPPAVKVALRVLLNHVEPGWENCRALVQMWLDAEIAKEEERG